MSEDLERIIAELAAALEPFADYGNWELPGEFWPSDGDPMGHVDTARRALGLEVVEP